ncbi:MAG: magnesium and cobalt exporter, family [Frankiaceae bacterium]|nr:magnesium and cobalt exporter, family [Frankiaceae bacterium]
MTTLANIGIVLLLIVIEGLFVAAEIALVSLREGQVKALAAQGRRGAAVARLAEDPNRWLAAVQIGVTLTALLSSAFGAITLSEEARHALEAHGVGRTLAGFIGVVGVTLLISFVTLVIGELAPKRIGLQRPERVARLFAPVLDRVASFARPVIWLLSHATDGVVRLLGGDPTAGRDAISEEELRGLVAGHESLSNEERRLIDEVFAAAERQLREVLVPRTEVQFLEANTTIVKALRDTKAATHSRYPVTRGSADDVIGFVHIRDLILAGRGKTKVGDVVREVKMLPDTKRVLTSLSEMRREGHHLAVVVDEYGGTAGIVTLEDLIEEVIGDIRDEYDPAEPPARTLRGGDIEVDGLLNLDEFTERTGIELPEGPYETVAGYVMSALGHVPKVGEAVEAPGVRLKVTAMDGRRIERVRVTPLAAPTRTD